MNSIQMGAERLTWEKDTTKYYLLIRNSNKAMLLSEKIYSGMLATHILTHTF